MNKTAKVGARIKRDHLRQELAQFETKGELIVWEVFSNTGRTHDKIIDALKDADLDESVARELLPRHAFSRASKALEESRIIKVLREESDTITFQFTKTWIDSKEWKFQKETMLELNKTSGKITCGILDLQTTAQALLDKAMIERTTSDITRIVQKLFEKNADLYPIRTQGGVYFVPKVHLGFVDKIEKFLTTLDGEVGRMPVPAGSPNADKMVSNAVSRKITGMMDEINEAIDDFSTTTSEVTMFNTADRIKKLKFKMESYDDLLQEHRDKMKKFLSQVDKKLHAKVLEIVQEKQSAPAQSKNGHDHTIFGHPVTAVMRWMGANGWRGPRVVAALKHYGIPVNPHSVRTQVCFGKTGRQEPAKLTKKQIEELERIEE